MKNVSIIEIGHATEPLSGYARDVSNDLLVLASGKEPAVVLIHLGNSDKESLAPSINRTFMDLIERSREYARTIKPGALCPRL